jgi:hypothetical protein
LRVGFNERRGKTFFALGKLILGILPDDPPKKHTTYVVLWNNAIGYCTAMGCVLFRKNILNERMRLSRGNIVASHSR